MRPHALALVPAFLLFGCPGDPDDGGADTGSSGGSGESSSASMSASSTTAPTTSASTTVGTSDSTTVSTSTTTSDDTTTTDATGDTTTAESSEAESTAADGCTGLGRDECMMNESCAPIACRQFMPDENGGMFCLGEAEFIGCRSADLSCDEMRTITCEGDDAPAYACMDDCIPDGWVECPAPADGDVPPC